MFGVSGEESFSNDADNKNIIFPFVIFSCQLLVLLVNFNHIDLSPDAIFVLQQSKNVKKEKPCNKLSAVKKGKKYACLNQSQKQMDKTKEDYSGSACVQVM